MVLKVLTLGYCLVFLYYHVDVGWFSCLCCCSFWSWFDCLCSHSFYLIIFICLYITRWESHGSGGFFLFFDLLIIESFKLKLSIWLIFNKLLFTIFTCISLTLSLGVVINLFSLFFFKKQVWYKKKQKNVKF